MRFPTTCLGIALGALWITGSSLADDPAPAALAPLPANPVTSPAPADNSVSGAPTDSLRRASDKQERHGEAASAAPASAATPPAANAAAQQPAVPKQVCRNMDVLGSKIPKRVCATPAEWDSFSNRSHEDTQDGLRRLRDQGAIAPPSPGVSPSALPPTR